jgi:hypothetical protein
LISTVGTLARHANTTGPASRAELIERELSVPEGRARGGAGGEHARRRRGVTRPEPSPRLGWVLLGIVVLVVVAGCWLLMLAAERAMGGSGP